MNANQIRQWVLGRQQDGLRYAAGLIAAQVLCSLLQPDFFRLQACLSPADAAQL